MCWRLVGWLVIRLFGGRCWLVGRILLRSRSRSGRQPKVPYLMVPPPACYNLGNSSWFLLWMDRALSIRSLLLPFFYFYDLPILICTVGILGIQMP